MMDVTNIVATTAGSLAALHKSVSVELLGIRGTWMVQHLGNHIWDNNPSLVFLAETKCSSHHIELVKRKIDMNVVCIPSKGKGGGLELYG
ncbi:UNVERIFIED_CONTAM: hypothetical protein Slati_4466000 [Sesamum latifolium]|uniref:Uncharacterized protein n=1 Tax=Sesamum latifolium TaxID=2727402 RepID=A0AAW2ST08_9LAMI